MKILVINGSHRLTGSTKILIEKFKKLFDYDYPIKEFDLADSSIDFYNYDNKYSKDDYFSMIKDEMLESDMIIFASPIYWYSMTAKLKAFIDRMNTLFLSGEFEKLKGKKVGLLFTYGSESYDDCFIRPFELMSLYLKMEFIGFYGIRSRVIKENYQNKDIISLGEFAEKIKLNLN